MKDKYGKDITTGCCVRITGAYHNIDDGDFVVLCSPGEGGWEFNSHFLRRLTRDGKISTVEYSQGEWPVMAMCSDPEEHEIAQRWNKTHTEIKVIPTLDINAIIEYLQSAADEHDYNTEHCIAMNGLDESSDIIRLYRGWARHYRSLAEKLSVFC